MQVSGHGARLQGDTSGPKRLDWRAAYHAEQRMIIKALQDERLAGNDRWTAERTDGLYAPRSTTGLRDWTYSQIAEYARREAARRIDKAIAIYNEQQTKARN